MRHPRFFTTSLLISLVAIGCDVESEPVGSEKQSDMMLLEQDDDLDDLDDDDDVDEIDVRAFSKDELTEAVPGESPDDPLAAGGCVYVQWCDAPGYYGTVCRLRPGCVYNGITADECFDDTDAVCGGLTQPWTIY